MIQNFRFEHPEFLFFFSVGLLLLILLLLFGVRQKRKALRQFHSNPNLVHLRLHKVQAGLLMLSCLFVTLAIARPQFGAKPEPAADRLDIIFALDISTSMLAADIKPNRLHAAKIVIDSLIERLRGDRIGLLHFAEASFVVCPLTTDTSTLKEFLAATTAETLNHSGTRIGHAIETATARLITPPDELTTRDANNLEGQKALILFTDGEDHGEEAVEAAKTAHREGVYIYCVGVGIPELPAPIPLIGESSGYKRNVKGQVVLTTLDETRLRKIAKAGNGAYYHASEGIAQLTTALAQLEKQKFRIRADGEYEERFQWFVGAALILLVGELLLDMLPQLKPSDS